MTGKIECTQCGALILVETATRTGGVCMPCKNGTRERIDAGKQWERDRKRLEQDPLNVLWRALVHRVYDTPSGFDRLAEPEKLYFAVTLLEGEIYNGGFDQFFSNSSGSFYADAVRGLRELGAHRALELLLRAKHVLFEDAPVPTETQARRAALLANQNDAQLDELDRAFWTDQDNLLDRLTSFATQHGLIPQGAA